LGKFGKIWENLGKFGKIWEEFSEKMRPNPTANCDTSDAIIIFQLVSCENILGNFSQGTKYVIFLTKIGWCT
jgi:hypothetical protein